MEKKIMYKAYYAEEDNNDIITEFFQGSSLKRFVQDFPDSGNYFEALEYFIYNVYNKKNTVKRYPYKLEKITVELIGSQDFYGLGISPKMCEIEFN